MSIVLCVTDVRPDTSVKWYYPPAEFRQYVIENWLNTGRMLSIPEEQFSQDGLTRTLTTSFRDEQSLTEYSQDPVRRREHLPMIAYNTSNEIGRAHV